MGLGSVEAEPKGRLFVHVILGGELSGEGQGSKLSSMWPQLETGFSLSPRELWGMHCIVEVVLPWVES